MIALWVLFSLLTAVVWAFVNMADKFFLSKWVRNPVVPLLVLGFVDLSAAIIIVLMQGLSALSFPNLVLALLGGFFYIISMLFYYKAVQLEEISRVIPLFYLAPFFVAFLAALFVGEIFTPLKYFGIFLLVLGAILISMRRLGEWPNRKAFFFAVLSAAAIGTNAVITKYLLDFADFWTVFAYTRGFGIIFVFIPLLFLNFGSLRTLVREHGAKALALISFNEGLNLLAVLFLTFAIALGPVTLVNALSSTQTFFVLLFSILVSLFFPKLFTEKISRSIVLAKAVAIAMIFAGALLVT